MFVMGVCRATGGVGVSYYWIATQMGGLKIRQPCAAAEHTTFVEKFRSCFHIVELSNVPDWENRSNFRFHVIEPVSFSIE